ncbi:MAG: efflux RND transporter periplasmic adaptor subunit [Anaerolineae bacterium]
MTTENQTDHGRRRHIAWGIILFLLILSAAAYVVMTGQWPMPLLVQDRLELPAKIRESAGLQRDATEDKMPLTASGVVQAEAVDVASEVGGQIVEMAAVEGEPVTEGQVVVRLDTSLLDAQIRAAEAAIAVAQAGLDRARAGARPGQVAVAEAQLAQSGTAADVARQTVTDTRALLHNPQQIDLQIITTEGELAANRHKLEQALALKEDRKQPKEQVDAFLREWGYEGDDVKVPVGTDPSGEPIYETVHVELPDKGHLAHIGWWKAWVNVNATTARQETLEATLGHLYRQRENPQELRGRVIEAEAGRAQGEAQMAVAEAHLERLEAGATDREIAAVRARVAQAQAARDALLEQRRLREIAAPMEGVVLDLVAHPGEVAAPGGTLLTLADLTEVTLTVYVSEPRIGQVQLGQRAEVTVDSFPERTFEGTVAHIADSAEFTPRNVATQEERVTLVFAVEIDIPNEDGALKPGMPADVTFQITNTEGE